MALYNNGFPVGYQQAGYPYAPPYPQPPAPPQMPQTQMPGGNPQMMTPPTIRAEIVQVDGQEAAERYPLAAGMSQMMIAKDDSFIAVKTQGDGQQYSMTYYDRRPPAPPEPPVDLSGFVRREEVAEMIAAALRGRQEAQRGKKEGKA